MKIVDHVHELPESEGEKLDYLIEWLTESQLGTHGGYPHDFMWIGDVLAVADLDDGKERNATLLRAYTKDGLLAWYDRAEQLVLADIGYYGGDVTDALSEVDDGSQYYKEHAE